MGQSLGVSGSASEVHRRGASLAPKSRGEAPHYVLTIAAEGGQVERLSFEIMSGAVDDASLDAEDGREAEPVGPPSGLNILVSKALGAVKLING